MSAKKPNVQPTVEVIMQMSESLRDGANKLKLLAASMEAQGELELASEAAQVVSNVFCNLRLDLLVGRPLREATKRAQSAES
jgi:hypothetical protein